MTSRFATRLGAGLTATLIVLSAAPSFAQMPRTPRPYRALFDPTPDPDSKQSLDVSASLGGGWDSNALALTQARNVPLFTAGDQSSSTFVFGTGTVSYARRTTPFGWSARASSSTHYIPEQHRTSSFQSAAISGAGSFSLWSHAKLTISPSVTYLSQDRLHVLDAPEGDNSYLDQYEYGLVPYYAVHSMVTAGVEQQLSRRTTLSIGTTEQYSTVAGGYSDTRGISGAARLNHQISKNATAYFGYGYYQQKYLGTSLGTRERQSIDVGVNYGRALSVTRNTYLSFGTGSALVTPTDASGSSGGNIHAHLTGNATLTHEMGRSWRAQVGYTRAVRFIQEFADPLLSDSTSGSLAGFLGPRLDLSIVGAYSSGSNAASRAEGRVYDSYTGSGQLRFALTRYLSAYTEYLYYHYQFHNGVVLLRDLPSAFDRQDVRAGVTITAPLLR